MVGKNPSMAYSTNIALVSTSGDLDVTTVDALRRTLDAVVASGCRRIVLNMASTSYMDSAGMGLMVSAVRRMRDRGGLLSLINVSPEVLRALSIARLVDFLPVSGSGERPPIPALEPGTLPLWRTMLRIDPTNLAATRQHVGKLLGRMRLSSDDAFDLGLAVGEAMGNAVDHGDGCSLIDVACYADRVVIEVSDCGEGFSPELEDVQVSPYSERGRGIALMRLLADSVTISPKPSGSGTVVRIEKLLSV
jgi:anti-anti-sigma factor